MYFKVIYILREFPPKPVHTFIPILPLISVLILYNFIHNSIGVDFCQTFANNGFGIDYGFGGNINPYYHPKGFLIIDQNYWKLEVNISLKSVNFLSEQGFEKGTGFGKGYKTAFSYADELIGLINVSIEWTLDQIYWQLSHRKTMPLNGSYFRMEFSQIS